MSLKKKINELLAKIEAIDATKTNENTLDSRSFNDLADLVTKDLPSSKELSQKLEGLKSSRKNRNRKKQNKKDIFSEILGPLNKILESGRKADDFDKFASTQRLKRHAIDAADSTVNKSKEIVMDCVKTALFSNGGVCGNNKTFSGCTYDQVTLKPREIDFLNILTITPNSDLGKIIYEPIKESGKEKVNRNLFTTFQGTPYQFDTPSNKTLFTINWDDSNQRFNITGLTQGSSPGNCGVDVKVEDFLDDYYSSIEMPDIKTILKNAMIMTLNAVNTNPISTSGGGDTVNVSFDSAINDLERLLKKIMSFCGNQTKRDDLKNQNPTDMFDENDEDKEFYFNFDDVEGIDLDDEDARLRKVLVFQTCNNFEVPVNTQIVEDFIFLENKKSANDLINSTLNKAAADAFEQSDGSFDLPSFQLSLNIKFLINIPKAIIQSILSPKIFLPIVAIYKLFSVTIDGTVQATMDIKLFMKKLSNMFYCIIKEVFWTFLRDFWKRIKKDIKNFIKDVAAKIIKSKYKKYYMVISALIAFLKEIKEDDIDSCAELIETIIKSIDKGIESAGGLDLKIPKPLLALSEKLPSLNSAKIMMDTISKLQANGIDVGPINGENNGFVSAISSMMDSLVKNLAKAPMSTTNARPITVVTPLGPGIIPPFTNNSTGLFNT
jgi:hypothetical protein